MLCNNKKSSEITLFKEDENKNYKLEFLQRSLA